MSIAEPSVRRVRGARRAPPRQAWPPSTPQSGPSATSCAATPKQIQAIVDALEEAAKKIELI